MKKIVTFTIFAMLISFIPVVDAAGVTLSLDKDSVAANTATDVVLSWTGSATTYATGATISIVVKDYTNTTISSALAAHTTPDTDLDNDTNADGAFTYGTGIATYTITNPEGIGTSRSLQFRMPALTAGIYSISMLDSTAGDIGVVLYYVADDNDIYVTADVAPQLNFVIRTATDQVNLGDDNIYNPGTTATNEVPNNCPLGTLTLSAVSSCSYRLKVSTNASSGYIVSIASNGDLSKTTSGDVVDAEDIDPVVEGQTVTVGTEGYGIALNAGSATNGMVTEDGIFDDDDSPIPITPTYLYEVSGPNAPSAVDTVNTALVTHKAAIDSGTATGYYSQIVTYTVTGRF